MKKELVEKVVKVVPLLGLASLTFVVFENYKFKSQNRVMTAKIDLLNALLGSSNTMMKMYDDQLDKLAKENVSLKKELEETKSKKKKA
jgi:hypothetical protein